MRSRAEDGSLMIDFGTLMHEIGHGFDHRIATFAHGGNSTNPLHEKKEVVDAHKEEHLRFPPGSHFHDISEFVAEVFAQYSLDRGRAMKMFPKMCKVLDDEMKRLSILTDPASQPLVNAVKLKAAIEAMIHPPPIRTTELVTGSTTPSQNTCLDGVLRQETLNSMCKDKNTPRSRYAVGLVTEDLAGARLYAKFIARQLFYRRTEATSGHSLFNIGDAFFEANMGARVDEELAKKYAHHAFVLFSPAAGINANSPGMQDYDRFSGNTEDFCVPFFFGKMDEIDRLSKETNELIWLKFRLHPLTAGDVATFAYQLAASEKKQIFSNEAKESLTAGIADVPIELDEAERLWNRIKQFQNDRVAQIMVRCHEFPQLLSEYNVLGRIKNDDVTSAIATFRKAQPADPIAELNAMIGLADVKAKIKGIEFSVLLDERNRQRGRPVGQKARFNLLFLGNPGTGKTVVSQIFRRVLQKLKIGDATTKFAKLDTNDIKTPDAAAQLWRDYKNGVIFIDEIHQFNDSEEKRKCFRAMVPFLADPEYAQTVFIGAGYTGPTTQMIDSKDIDEGLTGRFSPHMRIEFADYTRDELGLVWDMKIKGAGLISSTEVRTVAMQTVMRRQRCERNPSNARAVEKLIESAKEKLETRIREGGINASELTDEDLDTLEIADVRDEPKVSMDDVWARLDRDYAVGYDDVKATLREIQNSVEHQRRQNDGEVVPESYNFAIQGPPGTGKTVFARDILGPFFCALDIIPSKDVVEKSAGDLIAQYVGQTTYLVRQQFSEGWGKVIFFDEISGICESHFGKDAVKELLPTLENNPGKFVFVVADYTDNIDRFFAMDGGLLRRIKYRITLKPWDVETSLRALLTKMAKPVADKGYGLDLRGHEDLLRELLDTLVREFFVDASGKYSGFSSGGTVCATLASVIYKKYASTLPDANAPVSEAVLRVAFAEVLAQLQEAVDGARRASGARRPPSPPVATATATESKAKADVETDSDTAVFSIGELNRYQKAMKKVDMLKKFCDRYNSDPALLAQDQADVNSDYNKELAKELNVDSAAAQKIRVRVAVTVKKLIQRNKTVLVQRFKYHCPWCKEIDSPVCGFINRPLEWKIEHSTKKPWNEEVTTTETVEIDVQTFEDREV